MTSQGVFSPVVQTARDFFVWVSGSAVSFSREGSSTVAGSVSSSKTTWTPGAGSVGWSFLMKAGNDWSTAQVRFCSYLPLTQGAGAVAGPAGADQTAHVPAPAAQGASGHQALLTTTRVITAAYDGLLRLSAAREQPGTFFRYGYDLAGNRTGVWVNGTQTISQTYNAADQVTGWQYDPAGNLLSDGAHEWTYDALGRMTGVRVGGEQGSYSYNGDGVLVGAQGSWGQNERYAVDLAAPLSQVLQVQYPVGTTSVLYGRERLGLQEGGATTWLIPDALGSVRQTADSAGMPGGGIWYDPWGRVEQGRVPSFGFAGEQHDAFTGQLYLRARWYAPGQGRFLSWRWAEDESDDLTPYSHHAYAYALSDPLLLDDPSGRCPSCIGAVVGGLIGAGIAYGSQVVNNVNQHGLNGAAFTNVDGRAVLAGAVVGAVGGATFGLGLSAGTAVATAAGLTSASGTAASAVGVATVALSSVVAGQASRATANAFAGQPVTRGLFQPKDMLVDAALGVAGFKVFGGKFNKIAPPPPPHALTNPPRSLVGKIDDWWTSWRGYRKIRFRDLMPNTGQYGIPPDDAFRRGFSDIGLKVHRGFYAKYGRFADLERLHPKIPPGRMAAWDTRHFPGPLNGKYLLTNGHHRFETARLCEAYDATFNVRVYPPDKIPEDLINYALQIMGD